MSRLCPGRAGVHCLSTGYYGFEKLAGFAATQAAIDEDRATCSGECTACVQGVIRAIVLEDSLYLAAWTVGDWARHACSACGN